MPNFNFNSSDSLYKFLCFFGICWVVLPHIWVYYLTDNSMLDTYKYIYTKIGVFFSFIILSIYVILSILILFFGIFFWYKNDQIFSDKKHKNEIAKIIDLNNDENKNRIKTKVDENNNKVKNTLKDYKALELKFYNYLVNKYKNEYIFEKNIKILTENFSRACDIIAKSKFGYFDKIYEIKIGKIFLFNMDLSRVKLLDCLRFYGKKCKGEISYIVKNVDEKNEIINYYQRHKELFNFDQYEIIVEAYVDSDL